ncbi:MAG: prohibitin family protein [Actinobacteria bacterium]|nr:prohibitin family protein [Actinomycetota bacterium]MBM3713413.1 prohibitin family protein [Actinomycetota bacterium]
MKKKIISIFAGVIAFIFALLLILNSLVIVQAGNVKVLTQFGRTTGVVFYPGLHMKIPFIQNTTNYSTRQVTYETSDESEVSRANFPDFAVDTTSSDGQQIKLKFTIRFAIDGKKAEWILNNIGTMDDLVEKIVKAEARSLARNIPKKYTAAQLYSEQVFIVQEEIGNRLRPIFDRNGIILDDFLLRKIDFTEDYFNVLEEKQIAEERIVVEQNILEQEKIKKEQAIIKAEAEARQIEIKGEALKSYPQIIQLEFIQKLSPNISWGILPGEGIVPFLDIIKLQEDLESYTNTQAAPQTESESQEQQESETESTD